MSSESEESGKVTEIVKVVGELVEKVPIYQDAVQPAAKEVGKGLQIVARAVNAALTPVEGLIWGVEQIRDFVRERVSKKLENVPPEDIQQPKPHVGVPAIDALRYTGSEEALAALYANLLATSMDRATAYKAHPGFVDIIKNMCPDEARILKHLGASPIYPIVDIRSVSNQDGSYRTTHRHLSLIGIEAGCEHVPLAATYLDNLERLGLVSIDSMSQISGKEAYARIEEHPEVKAIVENLNTHEGRHAQVQKMRLTVTDLGNHFIRACVIDKETQPRS